MHQETNPCACWIGEWVGPRDGEDISKEGKICLVYVNII
jgi:hypothetical protein